MSIFNVNIERNGHMLHVGDISGSHSSDACFQYDADYLTRPDAAAISISMPLQADPYSPGLTAAFFEGLLPEGFTRRSVAQWMHVEEADYLSLLHGLGRECLGALSITEAGENVEASYEPINSTQIRELAAEGAVKSAEIVTKSHLSLTGASGKVGLYLSPSQDAWYLPHGTAPSTHIVKQSHVRLEDIIANEQLSLMTASRCGIPVPKSFIIDTGEKHDHELLFATERYDRIINANSASINGLPRPRRLHQEDFAQAMGIPSSSKYERAQDGYMKKMFDVLRMYSSDPITDQLRLWDRIVFNYLIGNTDAHIKNYALLYAADLQGVRLAPAYDVISTTIYEQSTHEMAFGIGGVTILDDLTADDFRRAAKECGIGEQIAMKHYHLLCKRFCEALAQSAKELSEMGYRRTQDIMKRILETGGVSGLVSG